MNEQFAPVGDVELCFEEFGERADPTLLLVMGLGTQMLGWDEGFCRGLVARGFHVVRYDNRDVGRSSHLRHLPTPGPLELAIRRIRQPSYLLADMADDAAGLLDHLGLADAHVVGASMGGMIAQTLAARRPGRVRSLTSIMSSTGNRWSGQPHPRVFPFFLSQADGDVEAYAERAVALFKVIGSPEFRMDEDEIREIVRRGYERGGGDVKGMLRQLAAIIASGDRTAELRTITAPTLVIHGTRDRMVRPSGAKATAKAIPGARLMMIEGMGHDLPRQLWGRLADAIAQHAHAADAAGLPAEAAAGS